MTGAPQPAAAAPAPATRTRWHPLLVVATVLLVAGVSVILPVAGTLAALALFAGLRTAGLVQRRTTARRAARGARTMDPVVTVVTLPWYFLRALFALRAPRAARAGRRRASRPASRSPSRPVPGPTVPSAYAAGALVLFYGLGPGSGMPRAQLRRFFGAFTKSPDDAACGRARAGRPRPRGDHRGGVLTVGLLADRRAGRASSASG